MDQKEIVCKSLGFGVSYGCIISNIFTAHTIWTKIIVDKNASNWIAFLDPFYRMNAYLTSLKFYMQFITLYLENRQIPAFLQMHCSQL